MKIEVLRPHHLQAIEAQPAQRLWQGMGTDYESICSNDGYAVLMDGRPVIAGGVIEMHQGRGLLWCVMAQDAGRVLRRLTRLVQLYISLLTSVQYHRLELTTQADFKPANRWAALLGFNNEGLMRGYGPDKKDHYLWARVREANNG